MKLDIDLQSWSEFISVICNRSTPYEELTEIDQVSDRLALEKWEVLLDRLDPQFQEEWIERIRRKMNELQSE